ncbi:PIR protein [Plasmodium vivax]|nr:PIR protein [Plasmodium vivax]
MEESYIFCNDLDYYIGMEKWISEGYQCRTFKMSCEYNYNDFEEKDALKDLCAKFKCFYSLLFDPDGVKAYSDNENVEYLNYWLNNEFKNKKISSISASNFYQKFIFYDILFDTEKRLRDKIYKIKEEHLKQMDILYDLNTIYNNIKSNLYYDKQKCIDYSKDCVHKYKEAIKPCSINKNTKYCDALMAFKIKYENIESMNLFGGDNTECVLPLPTLVEEKLHRAIVAEPEVATSEAKQLPEESNEQYLGAQDDLEVERQAFYPPVQPPFSPAGENNNDNNNSIFTIFGIILSTSVFSTITYKFTPFGSWINRQLKRNKINWRNVEDENETKRLLEHNYDPKQLVLRDVPYSVPYNSL